MTSPEKLAQLSASSRKVFGTVVSNDVPGLYAKFEHLRADRLPYEVAAYATAQYIAKNDGAPLTDNEEDAFALVKTGVTDIYNSLIPALEHTPELTDQQAVAIALHPETVATLALIARHPHNETHRIIRKNDTERRFGIDASRTHLEAYDTLRPSATRGCPFVTVTSGEALSVTPDPLFSRFTAWAGHISVLNYFDFK